MKDWCQEDGVVRIWAGTSLENAAARRTFEGSGARRLSERYAEYVYDLVGGGTDAPSGDEPASG